MTDHEDRRTRARAVARALAAATAPPADVERHRWTAGTPIYVPEVDPK